MENHEILGKKYKLKNNCLSWQSIDLHGVPVHTIDTFYIKWRNQIRDTAIKTIIILFYLQYDIILHLSAYNLGGFIQNQPIYC